MTEQPPDPMEIAEAAALLQQHLDLVLDQYDHLIRTHPAEGVHGSLTTYLLETLDLRPLAALLASTIIRLAEAQRELRIGSGARKTAGLDWKYGHVVAEFAEFEKDEPVVVFRAKDQLLPEVLVFYRGKCEIAGSPQHHIEGIDATKKHVVDWQATHYTQVPRSDGPAEL